MPCPPVTRPNGGDLEAGCCPTGDSWQAGRERALHAGPLNHLVTSASNTGDNSGICCHPRAGSALGEENPFPGPFLYILGLRTWPCKGPGSLQGQRSEAGLCPGRQVLVATCGGWGGEPGGTGPHSTWDRGGGCDVQGGWRGTLGFSGTLSSPGVENRYSAW